MHFGAPVLGASEVVPELFGQLIASQLARMCGHHSEQEYAVLAKEVKYKASQRLRVHHFVALNAGQVLAHKVELPAMQREVILV